MPAPVDEVEEEPLDVNPPVEEIDREGAEAPLDSEDDDGGTAELMELKKAMPLGYEVASNPPSLEQLTFRNEHAALESSWTS